MLDKVFSCSFPLPTLTQLISIRLSRLQSGNEILHFILLRLPWNNQERSSWSFFGGCLAYT